MRIVLDTNILIRANAKARGPARELLQIIVASADHTLLLSPFLLEELERVFEYERVRVASKLTDQEVAQYLSFLRARNISEVVFPGPAPRVVPSDPDDDPVEDRRGPADDVDVPERDGVEGPGVDGDDGRAIVHGAKRVRRAEP